MCLPVALLPLCRMLLCLPVPPSRAPPGSQDALIVQGSAVLDNVNVAGGNLVYCTAPTETDVSVSGGSQVQSCTRFDFTDTNTFLAEFSSVFSQLAPTGAPTRIDGQFNFTASPGVTVNVFTVPARLFDAVQALTIAAPPGVFVVINVKGDNNTIENFQTVLTGGINASSIIYNFFNTTTLAIQDIQVVVRFPCPPARARALTRTHMHERTPAGDVRTLSWMLSYASRLCVPVCVPPPGLRGGPTGRAVLHQRLPQWQCVRGELLREWYPPPPLSAPASSIPINRLGRQRRRRRSPPPAAARRGGRAGTCRHLDDG